MSPINQLREQIKKMKAEVLQKQMKREERKQRSRSRRRRKRSRSRKRKSRRSKSRKSSRRRSSKRSSLGPQQLHQRFVKFIKRNDNFLASSIGFLLVASLVIGAWKTFGTEDGKKEKMSELWNKLGDKGKDFLGKIPMLKQLPGFKWLDAK